MPVPNITLDGGGHKLAAEFVNLTTDSPQSGTLVYLLTLGWMGPLHAVCRVEGTCSIERIKKRFTLHTLHPEQRLPFPPCLSPILPKHPAQYARAWASSRTALTGWAPKICGAMVLINATSCS